MPRSLTIPYINSALLLLAAWGIYAFCQDEFLLPGLGACILLGSLFQRTGTPRANPRPDRLRFPLIITLSFIAGLAWRSLFPGAGYTAALFPLLTAAAQSATIIAAVLVYLKPRSRENLFLINLLAWLTVATAVNLSFRGPLLFLIGFFCLAATAFVLLETMTRPANRKYTFLYYRDFILFSALVILLTTGFTIALSRSIAIVDNALMDFISDYVIPRGYTNFLSLDPEMSLMSPGASALDKRPVLEAEVPPDFFRYPILYLKIQVFKEYQQGKWKELRRQDLAPLPHSLTPGFPTAKLTMFTRLGDIIPVVAPVTAVRAPGTFLSSRDKIVYAVQKQNQRVIEFSFEPRRPAVQLSGQELAEYTALPPDMAPALRRIANSIAGSETDDRRVAQLIRNYFRQNFQYTLEVDFKADNRGLVRMIREKRPAYCSYFATASALLLRARGIPARVVTGFLTGEKTDPHKPVFLARVRNAHAWTEALWPETDRWTGQTKLSWHVIDATPGERAEPQERNVTSQMILERFLEQTWIKLLRWQAAWGTLDHERLQKLALILLLALLAAINLYRILRRLRLRRKPAVPTAPPSPELQAVLAIYRRYEAFLQARLEETRRPADTDRDVLSRLARRTDIPPTTIVNIREFLALYQAVRFGQAAGIDLEPAIKAVEQSAGQDTPPPGKISAAP